MVSFDLDPETRRVVKALGDFVDTEVLPLHDHFTDLILHESRLIQPDGTLHPEVVRVSREVRRKSAKQGFYALHLPTEVGGLGLPSVGMLAAWKEVFTRGLGFTMAVLASLEGPTRMLLALDADQRKRWLDPLVKGEKTTCFALTEPGAGSDVRAIRATARLDGDDWVLNGHKTFITNGPYADFAQVVAKTDDAEDAGLGAISVFLVPKGTPGFEVGPVCETIANNGLPSELLFKDCRVPKENVLGAPGEGFYHVMQNINDTRLQIGGMSVGLAQYCLDRTVRYVTERTAFGKPVGKYQGVSFPLADALTEMRAAEMLALYTAWKVDQGDGAIQETSMTKLYATEMLWSVADRCIGAHGGAGALRATMIERILRWARVMRIFEGTSEIQRVTIAKTMGL